MLNAFGIPQMLSHTERLTRFKLPTRIRSTFGTADEFGVRLLLADRIATLPGVTVVDDKCGNGSLFVRILLAPNCIRNSEAAAGLSFAEISRDGILVYGLRSRDKHQVLSRGWGKLQNRNMLIYLPRDQRELEVCWSILNRAFDHLTAETEGQSRPPVFLADVPRTVAPRLN